MQGKTPMKHPRKPGNQASHASGLSPNATPGGAAAQVADRQAYLKNLTLRQIRIFEAVATHLSFSRAAEQLSLTQPAVSMQVQQLQTELGLQLVCKTGKKSV